MQSHIIRSQVFEMNCSERSQVHELQNRISRIVNLVLMDGYQKLFDQLIESNTVFRLEKLVIDLDFSHSDWTDEELVYKIMGALDSELRYRLALYKQKYLTDHDTEELIDELTDDLNLLGYFLQNGNLPWWAGSKFSDLDQLVSRIAKFNASALRLLLLEQAQNESVRRRIVYQLSNHAIGLFITVLQPAEASFILNYHTETIKVHKKDQVVKYQTSEVEKSVWIFILDYLFMLRGSVFNRKEFVKHNLVKMSAHFNLQYLDFLQLFYIALEPENQIALTEELSRIIRELANEEDAEAIPGLVKSNDAEALDSISDLQLLKYYLLTGSLPLLSKQIVSKADLVIILSNLLKKEQAGLRSLVLSEGKVDPMRERLTDLFDDSIFRQIINLIDWVNAPFILEFSDLINVLQVKSPIIPTETLRVKQSVWELITELLIVEHASVFNLSRIIEKTLKQLKSRYKHNLTEHLTLLTDNFDTISGSVLLLELLKELKIRDTHSNPQIPKVLHMPRHDTDKTQSRETEFSQSDEKNIEIAKRISLKNFIGFWILNGSYPWWGKEWFNFSPAGLIEQLIIISPEEAILLLKIASGSEIQKKRILAQLPSNTIVNLFSLIKSFSVAEEIFYVISNLLVSADILSHEKREFANKLLLGVYWDRLIEGKFKSFELSAYIQQILEVLAAPLDLTPDKLFVSLKSAASISTHQGSEKVLKYLELFTDKIISNQTIDHSRFSARFEEYSMEAGSLSEFEFEIETADIKENAIYILHYFLSNHKLPPELYLEKLELDRVLSQVLFFLYSSQKIRLAALLQQSNLNAEAVMQVHDRIYALHIDDISYKEEILKFLERDLLRYFRSKNSIKHDGGNLKELLSKFDPERSEAKQFLTTLLKYRSGITQIAITASNQQVYILLKAGKEGWEKNTESFLEDLYLLLEQSFSDTLEKQRFSVLFREYVLLVISGRFQHSNRESFFTGLIGFIAAGRNQSVYQLSILFKPVAERYSSTHSIARLVTEILIIQEQKKKNSQELDQQWQILDKRSLEDLNTITGEAIAIKTENTTPPEIYVNKDVAETNTNEKIYISNAGLVLLHPFFHTYYQRLEMVKDGQFINDDIRVRAIHLLQYLVFGTEQHLEHELVLNKMLCGLPLNHPIPMDIVFTEKEKSVSSELLKAALASWDKLRNSSVDSFRASFLQRSGALEQTGDVWTLKVEQRGYDVLLQTLPWSFGMIKTSMMDNFLNVEWI